MKAVPLKVRPRSEKERGTRACLRLRKSGEIPASLYGAKKQDGATKLVHHDLAVSAYDVMQLLDTHASILDIDIEGEVAEPHLALLKEVQRDVFGDDVLHIDLEMIDKDTPVEVTVQLEFKGDPKGAKEGGRVDIALHDLDVSALPRAMPDLITIRIDDLGVGDGIYVKDLDLPDGVSATVSPEQMVVQVVAQEEEAEEPEEGEGLEEAAAEPEVIGKDEDENTEGSGGE